METHLIAERGRRATVRCDGRNLCPAQARYENSSKSVSTSETSKPCCSRRTLVLRLHRLRHIPVRQPPQRSADGRASEPSESDAREGCEAVGVDGFDAKDEVAWVGFDGGLRGSGSDAEATVHALMPGR